MLPSPGRPANAPTLRLRTGLMGIEGPMYSSRPTNPRDLFDPLPYLVQRRVGFFVEAIPPVLG